MALQSHLPLATCHSPLDNCHLPLATWQLPLATCHLVTFPVNSPEYLPIYVTKFFIADLLLLHFCISGTNRPLSALRTLLIIRGLIEYIYIQWVPGLFRGKAAGAWRYHPPPSSAEVKVQLYLYSTSGPSWPVIGWTLPLHYIYNSSTNRYTQVDCDQFI